LARKEGRQQGLEEGREEEKLQTAKNLLNLGIDKNVICEATGLTQDDLDKLIGQ
jgi:predicted transposase/invertase (TIGR01784 family)